MDLVCAKGTKTFLYDYKFLISPNSSIIRCAINNMNVSVKVISDKEVKVFGDYDIDISYKTNSQYDSNFHQKQYNYQASSGKKFFMTERKSFLEIVHLEEMTQNHMDIKALAVRHSFISEPKCRAKIISQDIFHEFMHVQVLGEILIELVTDQKNDDKDVESIKGNIMPLEAFEKREVDVVNTSFYMKEDNHFICMKESSKEKTQKPNRHIKRNKPKFQKVQKVEPIQSWLFQIKENIPISEILKMDVETLQNKQDTIEAVSIDDVVDEKTFNTNTKQEEGYEEKEIDKEKITTHEVKIKPNLPKQLFI